MSNFDTVFVLSLKNAGPLTIEWVLDTLRRADLLARVENVPNEDDKSVQILIGADKCSLLRKASEYHIRKKCIDGTFRVYNYDRREEFSEDFCLEPAEVVYLVWQSIDNAMPVDTGFFVPGSEVRIKSHHTLLRLLHKCGWFVECFALHDTDHLRKLKGQLRSFGWLIDLSDFNEQLKEYFGIQIAFYYAFFGFYIKWLVPTAIWGLIVYYIPAHPLVTILLAYLPNTFWWTLFTKFWNRRSNELAFQWGSLDFRILEKTRSNFRGDSLILNPVTEKLEPSYSPYKRAVKQYLVGFPLIAIFCAFTVFTFVLQNRVSDSIVDESSNRLVLMATTALPRFLYQTASMRWNNEYKKFAVKLNDYENYRVASDYENNLTLKLFFFFGVSFLVGLIYDVITKGNFSVVEKTLVSFFLTRVAGKEFKVLILPYLKKKLKKASSVQEQWDMVTTQKKTLVNYGSIYYEYIEIFEQFTLVSMFSFMYPWCSLLALFYSYLKVRSDLFRLLHVYRRPTPQIVSGIGSWNRAFEFVGILSVILNVALIALRPDVRQLLGMLSDTQYILAFVALEHFSLAFKYLVSFGISDITKHVQMAKSRVEYVRRE